MHHPRFDEFIKGLTNVVDTAKNEAEILARAEPLLQALVSKDDWLDDQYAQPHPQYYQQYCLYTCPQERFSVVSFVWGPGQKTPVHDHTVWGIIGMLRGAEVCERFEKQADGSYVSTGVETLQPGMTDCVSPTIGDIHRVSNAYDDQVSISIHVYGADIGTVKRHVYVPDTGEIKEFVSGYADVAAVQRSAGDRA